MKDNAPSKAEKAAAKAAELAAQKEAKQAQLLSYFAAIMAQQSKIDVCAAALKAAKDEQNATIDLAGAAGFLKGEIRELMADAKAPRTDLQARANRMAEYRRWLGQPTEQGQADIEAFTKTPVEVRDELYWNRMGYNDGLYGRDYVYPDGMETRFGPHYDAGWKEGQERLIWAKHFKSATPPEPVAEPEKPAAAHPSEVTKDEIEEARAALDRLGEGGGDDEFEATPEELAMQITRPPADQEAI